MRAFQVLLFGLVAVLQLSGCRNPPAHIRPAFYYWKSSSSGIYGKELELLETLRVNKLYLKLFEVVPDRMIGAIPAAKTHISSFPILPDSLLAGHEAVQTIFISNAVLAGITPSQVDSLAADIVFLCRKQLAGMYGTVWPVREIQLDCDWTAGTRDAYFGLIRRVRARSGKRVSCTLRLYPFKYRDRLGVPPADRVMLMCYNLLNPTAHPERNTILDNKELAAYLGRKNRYPIPMDIALPVYRRAAWYRNGRVAGLISTPDEVIPALSRPIRPFWHELTVDTVLDGLYLRRGDLVKYEQIEDAQLLDAAALLAKRLRLSDTTTIALFDLDDHLLNHYRYETLDSVYRSFAP